MQKKVENWKFVTVGDISHDIAGRRQAAAVFVEVAIELGLLPDNRREMKTYGQKAKVLQMQRGSDPEKLCSGI